MIRHPGGARSQPRFPSADGGADRRTRGAHFVPNRWPKAWKRPQPAVAASGFDPFKW